LEDGPQFHLLPVLGRTRDSPDIAGTVKLHAHLEEPLQPPRSLDPTARARNWCRSTLACVLGISRVSQAFCSTRCREKYRQPWQFRERVAVCSRTAWPAASRPATVRGTACRRRVLRRLRA